MGVVIGFILAIIFLFGGLNEMKHGGFWGFIGGLVILALGVLYFIASNNTRHENRQKEIDKRVEDALRKRNMR